MKYIIDIPEDVYKRTVFYREFRDINDCVITLKALEKAVPLPQGHGRLIDADAYRKELWKEIPNLDYDCSLEPYAEGVRSAIMSLDDELTIIEADKGE